MKRKLMLMLIGTIFVAGAVLGAFTPTQAQETPVRGGILKMIMRREAASFGYPLTLASADRNFAVPFFDRLLTVAEGGAYKPELATGWETSADGKSITFRLRQGVKFHDGTDFNAQAVKANLDNLIPPKPVIIDGIRSVEVVDPYTVRINLDSFNNLILYQIATNYECFMYSPTALQKNGADWASTHPVGTGPFKLESFQRGSTMKMVKNPDYWEKGLPYLDGIQIDSVAEVTSQVAAIKARKAQVVFNADIPAGAQLRDEGYPINSVPGSLIMLSFDTKNKKILSDKRVRQAVEYAVDKEGICSGPGLNMFKPIYQIVPEISSAYNKACPPRKYDPAKAKQLLAEAGYPNGFTFKAFFRDTFWREGIVAIQDYLAKVGVKMDVQFVGASALSAIILQGKIEPGAGSQMSTNFDSDALLTLDYFWRSDANQYPFVARPAGIDNLIDKAKSARDDASRIKTTQDIVKLLYDDETIIPLWVDPRIVVVDKSVQNDQFFINGHPLNNRYDKVWLKK